MIPDDARELDWSEVCRHVRYTVPPLPWWGPSAHPAARFIPSLLVQGDLSAPRSVQLARAWVEKGTSDLCVVPAIPLNGESDVSDDGDAWLILQSRDYTETIVLSGKLSHTQTMGSDRVPGRVRVLLPRCLDVSPTPAPKPALQFEPTRCVGWPIEVTDMSDWDRLQRVSYHATTREELCLLSELARGGIVHDSDPDVTYDSEAREVVVTLWRRLPQPVQRYRTWWGGLRYRHVWVHAEIRISSPDESGWGGYHYGMLFTVQAVGFDASPPRVWVDYLAGPWLGKDTDILSVTLRDVGEPTWLGPWRSEGLLRETASPLDDAETAPEGRA